MKGLCEPCLAHGIDVAQHLVDGLGAVCHLDISLGAYVFTQGYYLVVLTDLAAQTLYVAALQLALQAGIEEKSLTLGLYVESFGLNLALIVGTCIQTTKVPRKRRANFIISLKAVFKHVKCRIAIAALQEQT